MAKPIVHGDQARRAVLRGINQLVRSKQSA